MDVQYHMDNLVFECVSLVDATRAGRYDLRKRWYEDTCKTLEELRPLASEEVMEYALAMRGLACRA